MRIKDRRKQQVEDSRNDLLEAMATAMMRQSTPNTESYLKIKKALDTFKDCRQMEQDDRDD